MTEVSVIVPNFNHGQFLKSRIDSILTQTFQEFELIILDDCSSDNSREILESYRYHKKVTCIDYNTVNSGSPFRQWAKGIAISKGNLIWIAESDDWAANSFLEKAVDKMKNNPTAGVVYCQSRELELEANRSFLSFTGHPRFSKSFRHDYFNEGKKEIEEKLIYENTIPNASAVLFRKDICLRTGGVEENLKLCGDWYLWVKMLLISDICFIAEPLNTFRLTPQSARSNFSKLDTFHERMEIVNYMKKHGIPGAVKAQIRNIKMLFNNYTLKNWNKAYKRLSSESTVTGIPKGSLVFAAILSVGERISRRFRDIESQ